MNVQFQNETAQAIVRSVVVIDARELPLRKIGSRDAEQVLVISSAPTVRQALRQCSAGVRSLGGAMQRLVTGYFYRINVAYRHRQSNI